MRKSRFTEEQIIAALKEHDAGAKVRDLCRKLGVSEHTFYRWRSKYGGMEVSDARKLKALEEENRRLKHIVADLTPDNQMLKVINLKKWQRPPHAARLRVSSMRISVSANAARAASSSCPRDVPIPQRARGGPAAAQGPLPARSGAAPLRLPDAAPPAAAQGLGHQPQVGLPPLSRGGTGRPPAYPQAHRRGEEAAPRRAGQAGSALEHGLRLRRA